MVSPRSFARLQRFLKHLAILTGTVVITGAGALWLGYDMHGLSGVYAAAAAILVCLIPGLLALMAIHLLQTREMALPGVLLGMGIRMIGPILGVVVVVTRYPGLADAGFVYYLVFFYLLVLAIETILSVPLAAENQSAGG